MYNSNRVTAFPTRWHVLQAKTRISLRFRKVWSASSQGTLWAAKYPKCLRTGNVVPRLVCGVRRRMHALSLLQYSFPEKNDFYFDVIGLTVLKVCLLLYRQIYFIHTRILLYVFAFSSHCLFWLSVFISMTVWGRISSKFPVQNTLFS